MPFLPVSREEFEGEPDFVLISSDAYVDHPSFGVAVVSRVIENEGFSICIIPQPHNDRDYMRFGAPKHAFLVSSGVCDSMVDNYTVAKNRRTADVYSEGGKMGQRPDRAVTVYCKALKRLYPNVPVIIGGIEASLRRFAHYDYWADRVMPSILVDSGADLLMYGMGERTLWDILGYVKKGVPIKGLRNILGTCYLSDYDGLSKRLQQDLAEGKAITCASFEEV